MEKVILKFEQLSKICKHKKDRYIRTENGKNKEVSSGADFVEYICMVNSKYFCNIEVCPIWKQNKKVLK